MPGHRYRTLFGFLLCLVIISDWSACSQAPPPSRESASPTQRAQLEPTKGSSPLRVEHSPQETGTIYVATEPALGVGGTLSAYLVRNGTLLWSFQTGVTYLSMTLYNGVVYAGGSLLSAAGQTRIYALNARDGTFLWSAQLPGAALSAPLVDQGEVYSANPLDGTVYALSAADGSLRWYTQTGVRDLGSSPLLVSPDQLYVGSHASGTLVDLQRSTGRVIWRDATEQQGISNLILSSNTLYFLSGSPDGTMPVVVHAVRSSDGVDIWHRTVGTDTKLSLVLSRNTLYLSRGENELLAIRARDGTLLWQFSLTGVSGGIASFQVGNGILYVVAKGARGVLAMRASDGIQLWKYQNLPFAPLWGVTLGGGGVYVTEDRIERGTVYAFEAMTGLQVWHFSIPSGGNLPSTVSTISGDIVIAHANTGKLYVLHSDGTISWFRDLMCPYPVAPFPIVATPK